MYPANILFDIGCTCIHTANCNPWAGFLKYLSRPLVIWGKDTGCQGD